MKYDFKRPFVGWSWFAPAIAAQIQIKHLRAFGLSLNRGIESGMINSGAPVEQQRRREGGHRWPVRPHFRTFDLEEQPYVIDSDVHVSPAT